jgi:ABC-type Fe3+ transport system permease subunit
MIFQLYQDSMAATLISAILFCVLYMLRVRVITNAKPAMSPNKPTSRLQRVIFAILLALFNAFFTAPLLHIVRHPVERVTATSSLTAKVPRLVTDRYH